jgi:hypothetical protein
MAKSTEGKTVTTASVKKAAAQIPTKKAPRKSVSEFYPIPATWPKSETCAPSEKFNLEIFKSEEAQTVRKICSSKETRRKPECLIPTFKLAAKAFKMDYPMVQCMFGRETSNPKEVAKHVRLFLGKNSAASADKEKIDAYEAGVSKGNGKGLGQLTTPAIRAVQELVDPTMSQEGKNNLKRFDCGLYQSYIAFFQAIDQPLPSIIVTKDKSPKELFTPFISTHNIAVSISYLYDMKTKILKESPLLTLDQIIKATAAEYNNARNPEKYGSEVLACSKEVRLVVSGIEAPPMAYSDFTTIEPEDGHSL